MFASRTTTSLLDALRDNSNEPAWAHIDARYRPVLTGMARRLGLGQSDAEDVAQQALTEFVRAFRDGRYDRSKGRLSSWILGIARNTTLKAMRARAREIPVGSTAVGDLPGKDEIRAIWEEQRDLVILTDALGILRDDSAIDDRTLLAFELVALRSVPAKEAARRCEMTVDQVYVARSRITSRLRGLVERMTAAFEEDL